MTISPSYADVKDGFGRIILHPETALSALIFIYKNNDDGLPTLNIENAVRDKNNEPILYPAVYSSSSYGQKDLPKIFEYSLSKSTKFYEEFYTNEDKIPSIRLNMVNNILCSAYVDDIGIHEMRNSLFSYFINAYKNHGKILKTLNPPIRDPESISTTDDLLNATSQLSSSQFDVFLKSLSKFCDIQITQDINKVLSFCNFYLKEWMSFDEEHKKTLNINLPKENSTSKILRNRPSIADTQAEISKIQNSHNSMDNTLVKEDTKSITQLGRNISEWTYAVKNKSIGFSIKNTKMNFKTFAEAENYLSNNKITKRQLCSLMHSFYDLRNTILCQTMLLSIATWKQLHDTTKLEWDDVIPPNIIDMAILTAYSFFLECHTTMPRYQVSEHPRTKLFLIGMSDAGIQFHAYQLYLVSILHDSQETRVQLLSSITKTNHVHDRTIPYYEMTAVVELLSDIKNVVTYLENKNFHIPVENVRILTDSECSLIWARVLRTRFRIGVQTLITKLTLTMFDLNLCPFKNMTFIHKRR